MLLSTGEGVQVYDLPYQENGAASQAVFKTMAALDWKALLAKVDEAFLGWRVPSAILYGNSVCLPLTQVVSTIPWHR